MHRIDHEVYKRAGDFAARAHGDQKVPGSGFPYVVHASKVAMEVLAATEDEPELDRDFAVACALLHDTVEDSEPENRRDVVARLHCPPRRRGRGCRHVPQEAAAGARYP